MGTGVVGQTLAAKLTSLEYEVMIGTRNPKDTLAKDQKDNFGRPPFKDWYKSNQTVKFGTFHEAAVFGEVVINATNGMGAMQALKQAGNKNLSGKVLLDVSNPLDFSKGMPPSLFVCNTDSLAEQIQQEFPDAKVVKSLNTMNAWVMVNPGMVPGDHTVFISGNDAEAKEEVKNILSAFGWKRTNILDLGDITSARGAEMILPIWLSILNSLDNPAFNFHIATGNPVSR